MATGTKSALETAERYEDRSGFPEGAPRRGAALTQEGGDGVGRQSGLTKAGARKLAYGLGWFSLGLGLWELLAPRSVAKVAGVRGDNEGLIRLFGLREIASGIFIFAQGRNPAAAVWSRVAGDALDIASLGAALASPNSNRGRVAFAAANVLAVTALDVLAARTLGADGEAVQEGGDVHVTKSLVVNASPEELYQFWRDFENLPRFMRHLESVRATGFNRFHWVAKAPAGTTVEWDAVVTDERPGELIAWRSVEGSEVENSGSVKFERLPGDRGTVVRVEFDYTPPGGALGAIVAKLFGEEPQQQVDGDIRRFKQLIETGEVVVSDATLSGTGYTEQRPAQPAGDSARQ